MSEIEEGSRAITEVAKAGGKIADAVGKGIDAGQEIGKFLSGSSLKQIPRAIVSLLGGDWIIGKQVENIIKTQKRIHDLAIENGIRLDPSTLPWRLKVEFVRGMADEDDDTMQELWARLVVNATREDDLKKDVDRIAIDVMRRLSPQSARLFIAIRDMKQSSEKLTRTSIVRSYSATASLPKERVAMLIDHLSQLRCIQHRPIGGGQHATSITALGRSILDATE
jgi:hypothetical protein